MTAGGEFLWAELAARFGFQTLIVDRLRRWVGGADLARDLFGEWHAGDEARSALLGRGLPRPGRSAAKAARVNAAIEIAA